MAGGRPSKYRPEFAQQAKKLCELGATDAQLADFFEVSVSTINLWKINYPEFSESISVPKEIADARVEQSLYRRAMGYEHDEMDIRVVNGEIVETPIRKYYPPDATSMIFWLKNRKPADWRETKAVELTGAGGGPVESVLNVASLSTAALAELVALKDAANKG